MSRNVIRGGQQTGFTLIELLVVLVILGLLGGLIGPKLFGNVDKAKADTSKAQIENLGAALDMFRLENGRYPTSSEGLNALVSNPGGLDRWNGPYLKKSVLPKDGWDQEFVYRSPGEHGGYDLLSYGADQSPGGEGYDADIVSWE
ncbi:MAG: type II secretion system major pseudopilin GspG [Candidatus Competibacteraceae bacterium]|nr:type II secretion system major pseudopilin GspG [Candidatus Competibacteraceae bacterium]